MTIPQLPEHAFTPLIDEVIALMPKTRHAENRAKENGSICKVIHTRGTRICVQHLDNTDAWRWIELSNDPDWDIVRMGD
tara:strand:+ start:668 stop:904 length:237 start_codon:yes stop_codon:yes gene_type:complete